MAAVLAISERLRSRLGDATEDFVLLLNQFGESNKQDIIQTSRESFEKTLAQTELRIEEKLGDLKAEIAQVRGDLRAEMGQMEGRLEAKIAQSQSALIRWMFLFWIAQAGFIFGLLTTVFKR